MNYSRLFLVCHVAALGLLLRSGPVAAENPRPKRLLLLGQSPDNHPPTTHEYLPGVAVLEAILKPIPNLDVRRERADEPWSDGPRKLADADGCALFLSEGAAWLNADPRRQEAFSRLVARGGGVVVLHWAMGTKDAANIESMLRLAGGCHGGPDRRYAVIETEWQIAAPKHPILTAIGPLKVRDEFYYRLKFAEPREAIQPLISVRIEDREETVAWAWQRPTGGRSFGFSGLHFHDNWRHEAYRRLVGQAVLWTLQLPIPAEGIAVDVPEPILNVNATPAQAK
ncbi:MAG TPA: ThuA domain-containing protein [Pirellulales bacterium]|nr:ThuA domain-containing protein [Pirellulales bacterium]